MYLIHDNNLHVRPATACSCYSVLVVCPLLCPHVLFTFVFPEPDTQEAPALVRLTALWGQHLDETIK